jgi:acyl-CoA reductase-like NAD-dependent aldehyde dehydrogenase
VSCRLIEVKMPMWFFPIAIAAGNIVVLKPSEKDPSASLDRAAVGGGRAAG